MRSGHRGGERRCVAASGNSDVTLVSPSLTDNPGTETLPPRQSSP